MNGNVKKWRQDEQAGVQVSTWDVRVRKNREGDPIFIDRSDQEQSPSVPTVEIREVID